MEARQRGGLQRGLEQALEEPREERRRINREEMAPPTGDNPSSREGDKDGDNGEKAPPSAGDTWSTEEYKTARRKLFKLLHKFRENRDWTNKAAYLKSRKELAAIRQRLIKDWLDRKQKEVAASRNITEWWKAMSWYRRRKPQAVPDITKEAWLNHFVKLLEGSKTEQEREEGVQQASEPNGRESTTTTTGEPTQEKGESRDSGDENASALDKQLTREEIGAIITNLKNGKAAGEDGVAAEFLKGMPSEGLEELVEVIQAVWRNEAIIESWRIASIFPIFKKGDEGEAKNYRGISLLDLGYKILSAVMARRLADWLEAEGKLSEAQAGFRQGRSTMEQVFVLNTLLGNQLKKKRGKAYVAFVDFKAAFDKVSREKLWRKMEKLGINGKFLRMTQNIYRRTVSTVIVGEETTEEFDTNLGVRQGCPLSPILFNIYIDDLVQALREKGDGGVGIGPGSREKIYALLYADDAALIALRGEELARMLKTLEKWADRNEMEVSVEKTKIMVFRRGGRRKLEWWHYKDTEIEVVSEFKYLGFWFTTRNQYNTQARKAAGKTQQMINKVWGETRRAGVTDLRRRLFFMDATVKAAAFYGAELWGWKRRTAAERIQNRYVKASLGVGKTTPDYIWKLEAGRHSFEVEARRRAGNFLGRLVEMEEGRWAKKCLKEELRGIKNRNPSRWGRELQEALEKVGDGTIINNLYNGSSRIPIMERLEELTGIAVEQEIQGCWTRADKSSYCSYYKEIKKSPELADYWSRPDLKARQKEAWASWRCGNIVREEKKGFKDSTCRACKKEKETLEHIVSCKQLRREMSRGDKAWWEAWADGGSPEATRAKLLGLLAGPPDGITCGRLIRLERILKAQEETTPRGE